MNSYQYVVSADMEETKDAIMYDVESILRASNNESGALYGQADKTEEGHYRVSMHMGGTLFRIMHRPQMRLDIKPGSEGCLVVASFAHAWLDIAFHAALIILAIVAAYTFSNENDTAKLVGAAVAGLVFLYSLVVAIYRQRHEINAMLDYLQLSIQAAEEQDAEEKYF